MRRLIRASLLGLTASIIAAPQLLAVEADLDACIECHGSDGMGRADPAIPVIAGMPAAHIEEAIYAYVDGARQCVNEPRMCETVAVLTEGQVTAVAAYFSAQQRTASEEPFDESLATEGALLHERHCGACHVQPDDEDVADAIGIPLHGQRADYIRFAIQAYLADVREPLLDAMAHELRQLSADDLEALVNYYSSYRPGE